MEHLRKSSQIMGMFTVVSDINLQSVRYTGSRLFLASFVVISLTNSFTETGMMSGAKDLTKASDRLRRE